MNKTVAGFMVAVATLASIGAHSQEVVTIGHSAPLTGPQSQYRSQYFR